ncbi:hypothetical protein NDU88_004205 [Pleurodeles waltl]|uniref:Uncharacterized protein n=1 Tax=Pleurodeles waltl TaxID=8319 RepID=A0AAV7SI34_PLEWA|nr:hypothetical protein NDU88_004205 [Pleurodeles waltl]
MEPLPLDLGTRQWRGQLGQARPINLDGWGQSWAPVKEIPGGQLRSPAALRLGEPAETLQTPSGYRDQVSLMGKQRMNRGRLSQRPTEGPQH